MAWYTNQSVRVMGRLINVSFRYGSFNGMHVEKGKPLPQTKQIENKVQKLLNRPCMRKEREESIRLIQSVMYGTS